MITMIAAVISALMLTLPMLGVELPSREGKVDMGVVSGDLYIKSVLYDTNGQLIEQSYGLNGASIGLPVTAAEAIYAKLDRDENYICSRSVSGCDGGGCTVPKLIVSDITQGQYAYQNMVIETGDEYGGCRAASADAECDPNSIDNPGLQTGRACGDWWIFKFK